MSTLRILAVFNPTDGFEVSCQKQRGIRSSGRSTRRCDDHRRATRTTDPARSLDDWQFKVPGSTRREAPLLKAVPGATASMAGGARKLSALT